MEENRMKVVLKKNHSALRYWNKIKPKIKDTSEESFTGRNLSWLEIKLQG